MKIAVIAVGLLFPALASAASGSWSQRVPGLSLSVGRQPYPGRWISAPSDLPATAVATRIAWRIQLLSAAGPDLQIKLCQEQKCLPLTALSGQLPAGRFFTPHGRYRFVFSVARAGGLYPTVNVVTQQLTVNYKR